MAYHFGAGFVPVRKKGKLPRSTYGESYDLEYGAAEIEVHQDAFAPGERVLVVDDVLATGGTAVAAVALVEQAGAVPVGLSVLMELTFLGGRARLTASAPDAGAARPAVVLRGAPSRPASYTGARPRRSRPWPRTSRLPSPPHLPVR